MMLTDCRCSTTLTNFEIADFCTSIVKIFFGGVIKKRDGCLMVDVDIGI
jgi:hypothetical protein